MGTIKDKWSKLISTTRLREEQELNEDDKRNAFLSDYYRVVFSSSFRRLQDKTQVNPLASTDFVRRRLTHSFEVSVIGERMARVVAEKLKSRIGDDNYVDKFGKIVATACLLHDIGNPPFGHEGEKAIRNWAKKNKIEIPDYLAFDGNAQGFRIATRLQHHGKEKGMNLTAATLSSMLKYPKVITKDSLGEKFSIMKSERNCFKEICTLVGLKEGVRHPLSYIVEAADDIVNRIVDIEDGLKLNYISYKDVIDAIENISNPSYKDLLAKLEDRKSKITYGSEREKEMLAYQNLRVKIAKMLAIDCEEVFTNNIEEIEKGEFSGDLISKCPNFPLYKVFLDLETNNIFNKPEIVRVERGGKNAIKGLLEIYLEEVKSESKLAESIPEYLLFEGEKEKKKIKDIRRIVDYVSGMTDRFAISQYQELSGMSL